MSELFFENIIKVDPQKKYFERNGLRKNIFDLNKLIALLDRSTDQIIEAVDMIEGSGHNDEDVETNYHTKDSPILRNMTGKYSDAARITRDLDHLLTSLSQYKLNQTCGSNLCLKDSEDKNEVYLYGDPLHNESKNEISNYSEDPRTQGGSVMTDMRDPGQSSVMDTLVQGQSSVMDTPVQGQSRVMDTLVQGQVDMTKGLILQGHRSDPSIPICVRCNEPIYDNSLCALDGYWHQHHFMCRGCDQRLENQIYYVDGDQPFCETCHTNIFTDKCAYCTEPILDSSLTALNRFWHPEHFFCSSCQGPFNDNLGFHEQEGKPFCSDCYFDLFGHKCGACNGPITSAFVSAIGKKWHMDCFVCSDCHSTFETNTFRELNGDPYCEYHYLLKMGTTCNCCHQSIPGSIVSALGRKYHVDCFTCTFCLRKLANGSFKELRNMPYCQDCFGRLRP